MALALVQVVAVAEQGAALYRRFIQQRGRRAHRVLEGRDRRLRLRLAAGRDARAGTAPHGTRAQVLSAEGNKAAVSEVSSWVPVTERLPDDEMTVLIALDDGEVWTGFVDAERWHYVSGDPVDRQNVEHWMHFPEPPK